MPAPAHLWVMGDGPETAAAAEPLRADPRIEWLGPVGDEERAARLAGASGLRRTVAGGESFGVVLLEAMAAGTAVVASDLPGYRLAAREPLASCPRASPSRSPMPSDRSSTTTPNDEALQERARAGSRVRHGHGRGRLPRGVSRGSGGGPAAR